ncbi:Calexcitin-2 [Pseudolycoriella hygida]|uniref:Calexcitin-2 n=1 Tax=Pseudolycoriella hygida TaxID=35572 RepID=A0A9Q0RZB8_9DIPT|nr:Calexcitin-2 [Pseudolycoriella hygida]
MGRYASKYKKKDYSELGQKNRNLGESTIRCIKKNENNIRSIDKNQKNMPLSSECIRLKAKKIHNYLLTIEDNQSTFRSICQSQIFAKRNCCTSSMYFSILSKLSKYMNFMFDLEDASNDGTIDAQEFALVCSSYGLDANECEQAFAKMSKGAIEVNRDEFAVLWREYFSTDDVAAPGNFIFGKTSF